jgi:hypothetical protein
MDARAGPSPTEGYKHFDARDPGWTKIVLKHGASHQTRGSKKTH